MRGATRCGGVPTSISRPRYWLKLRPRRLGQRRHGGVIQLAVARLEGGARAVQRHSERAGEGEEGEELEEGEDLEEHGVLLVGVG
jgi:hypothetical protein